MCIFTSWSWYFSVWPLVHHNMYKQRGCSWLGKLSCEDTIPSLSGSSFDGVRTFQGRGLVDRKIRSDEKKYKRNTEAQERTRRVIQ